MKIASQQERNDKAREGVEYINSKCGLRWNFIASQISMKYHSFVHWKKGRYEFGEDRLDMVENLINKYKNFSQE